MLGRTWLIPQPIDFLKFYLKFEHNMGDIKVPRQTQASLNFEHDPNFTPSKTDSGL